jgi:two-component system, chemotaxis family, protein-glutamate methylesterase/glutaminase
MIVVGASMGGLRAVVTMLREIPRAFQASFAVVLHRHKDSDGTLRELLQRDSPLPVREPLDKEPLLPGHIYLAPADYHLLVESTYFCLSVDEPVRYARPSIDVLFESAADAFGPNVIGIVLTGANSDGALGAARIKARGGRVIVQDPATSEAPQMPQAALTRINPDYILPLERIAPLLVELTARPL